MDAVQRQLIGLLNAQDWTSGSALAQTLGLSREAISKRIRRLGEWGVEVDTQAGRGYRLRAPLELLDAESIRSGLRLPCPVSVLDSIESSNSWAMAQAASPLLCLAEHQSAGRGRRGRSWQSPFGLNLYLSLRWELLRAPEKLPALSLALGIRLAECLNAMEVPARIKWPNDLYLHGRKFAGLLIEQRSEAHGPCTLVIGLGMNVNMRDETGIDQAWTSLAREGYPRSRQQLAIELGNALIDELSGLSNARLAQTLDRFDSLDAFAGREVCIDDGRHQTTGRSLGIDDWGRILLQTPTGHRSFSVGDVSLRAR